MPLIFIFVNLPICIENIKRADRHKPVSSFQLSFSVEFSKTRTKWLRLLLGMGSGPGDHVAIAVNDHRPLVLHAAVYSEGGSHSP